MNTYLKISFVLVFVVFLTACSGNPPIRSNSPGEGTLRAMESSESLIDWASNNGQGIERKSANCRAGESTGRNARYSCNASNQGQSTQIDNQEVDPRAMRRSQNGRRGYDSGYGSNRNNRRNRNDYNRESYSDGFNYQGRAYIRR